MLTARDLFRIDALLDNVVRQCHPSAWDENHITYCWLATLRAEWHRLSSGTRVAQTIRWDAYKMTGALEQANGDIAFVIDVEFPNGNTLVGVGFLEAKRVYPSGRYEALTWPQLFTLYRGSPQHQLLLYDYAPLPVAFLMDGLCCCADECTYADHCDCLHDEPSERSATIVVPSAHAIAFRENSRTLEQLGTRLAEQVVLRYFRGLDLVFDEQLVERVMAGRPGGLAYLAVGRVAAREDSDVPVDLRPPRVPSEQSGFRLIEAEPNRKR